MASQIELKEKFENKFWRMNNLYWIIDATGKKIPFKMNWAQEKLYDELWHLNIILKARQFGCTTFVDIYFLDECIFNDNIEAGIIAHNKEDAQKIFRRKVHFPYSNLPSQIKSKRYPTTNSKQELAFNNNSTIYVGTSMRSGTLQYLHVSEHGKICRKYPEKAEEIRTGSLNAVAVGQMVIIESTAEGGSGDFFDYCQVAKKTMESKKDLTALDWKFHFLPWFWHPDYVLDPTGVSIDSQMEKYFANVERTYGVKLSLEQRAWYVKKAEIQGRYMKREYPATPEEAFEGAGRMFSFGEHHIIDPMPIPQGAHLYFTYDWGFGAPYSIGYWWVDGDGRIYRFSEIYGQSDYPGDYGRNIGRRQTDEEVCETILTNEEGLSKEYGINLRSIVRLAGPDCFQKKPDYKGGGQGPSTAETMAKKNIYLTPADPSRHHKIRQFHQRLRLYDDMPPMLLVYNTCKEFIRTIPMQVPAENDPEYIDTNIESHAFDEACHVMMARPLALEEPKKRKTAEEKRIDELLRPKDFDGWEERDDLGADESYWDENGAVDDGTLVPTC